MILTCDIVGRKTSIAFLAPSETGLRITRREVYQSGQHASLDEIVTSCVGPTPPRLKAAGFGIPGPVVAGQARTTNLPWTVDGARLACALQLDRVSLLNDAGHGDFLPGDDPEIDLLRFLRMQQRPRGTGL